MSEQRKPAKKSVLFVPEPNAKLKSNTIRVYDFMYENKCENVNKNHTRVVKNVSNDDTYCIENSSCVTGSSDLSELTDCATYALRYVSMYPSSEAKLRQKLASKGFSDENIGDTIDYLKDLGYIDDLKLAQNAIIGLSKRLWGEKRIVLYLKSKGFSNDTISDLDFSEIDFSALCRKLVEKYPASKRNTMLRALYTNGFTSAQIESAVGRTFSDED